MIKIVDNFLTNDEYVKTCDIINNLSWKYGHISNYGSDKFWNCSLDDNPFFTEYVFKKIEKYSGKKYEIIRVYANGQTYGLDGSYHYDELEPECYTFLMYTTSDINCENVNEYDGHTLFKKDDRVICVEPIANRCVLFNSNILHKGMGPSKRSNFLRTTVAFKLREIK